MSSRREFIILRLSSSLSLLPFTLTCTCIGKMNARRACGTYIQSTLSRVPLLERPSHRTFRFFMLRSILYSPDVIFFFSRSLPFAICPFASRTPVKPLIFSLLYEPEEETPFEVFYGFVFRRFRMSFLSPLPSLFLAFLSSYHARIFRKIDNKIHMCMRNSFDIFIFNPLLFVSTKSSRCYVIIRVDFTK